MARKVNTKFLTIITILILGAGVGALVVKKFLIRESPESYVARGTEMMAQKKYDEAVRFFQKACLLDPKNPSLWVAYGDALNQLSSTDVEYLRKARDAWDRALAVDPRNKPALDRMMQLWSDWANLDPSRPDVFKRLRETATNLNIADPKNTAAEAAMYTSVIRPWLGGVETSDAEVDNAIAKLQAMMSRDSANAELPMFVAEAKLRKAEKLKQMDTPSRERSSDRAKMETRWGSEENHKRFDALLAESRKLMEDALKAQPNSAAMYYSAAQVAAIEQAVTDQQADREKAKQRERETLNKARELAKLDDPLYVNIHIIAARRADNREEGEKILRGLLEKRPDDQTVRLAVAEQLATNRDKRKEALEILDRPMTSTDLKGPKAYMVRELEIQTLALATNLRLDMYAVGTPKEQKDLEPKIQQGLDFLVQKEGDGARSLRLRGKMQRLQGKTVEAIQTLEKARALAEKNTREEMLMDRLDRWEVVDLLARAYIDTKQTGRAKALLTELVNRFPTYEPARMLLAQLLLKEGDWDHAREHVNWFQQHKPEDSDVIKLELQLQMITPTDLSKRDAAPPLSQSQQQLSVQQKEVLKQNYARLPETNRAEIMDKANVAMVIGQKEEGLRLMSGLWEKNKADLDVTRYYVRVLRASEQSEKAVKVAKDAAATDPKNESLQLLARRLSDTSPGAILKLRREESLTREPFQRELIQADCDRLENNLPGAFGHLQEAQKLQPNNTEVTSLIFNNLLLQQRFDDAEALIGKLSSANQDQCGGILFRYRLAMAREDVDAALKYARDLTQKMPEFGQSWLALGQALQAAGKNDEALSRYLSALEKQSDSPDAFRGIIDCYYALGRPQDARRYLTQARKAIPDNRTFQEMEINHELTWGDPEKAIPAREEAMKRDSEKAGPVLACGQAYLGAGRAALLKNPPDVSKAMDWFIKARDTFRQGITKWPDEMAFYAYYAETSTRAHQEWETEALLKGLANRDGWKGKVEPQQLLAEFYQYAGKSAEAETALRGLVAANPKNVDLQLKLASVLASQKKTDEALKVLDANSQIPDVARKRVEIQLASGKSADAEATLADILAKNPNNIDLLILSGYVNTTRGEYKVAEQRLSKALEIDPKNPKAHYYFGMMRSQQPRGNIDDAIQHFVAAKEGQEVGVDARFALSECYRRKGDPDGAIRELESALVAQPLDRRVRLALLDSYAETNPPRWVDEDRVIKEGKNLPQFKNDPDILKREASMLAGRGMTKEAIARIEEAVSSSPKDLKLRQTQLQLLLKVTAYTNVVQEADKLIAEDPKLWWAYEQRAIAKRFQGKKNDAIADFDAALNAAASIRDDDAATEIVRAMGDVIGADEAIMRIATRAEKEVRWKLMTARLQQAKGDTAGAIKTLETVLAMDERGELTPIDRENTMRLGGTIYLMAGKHAEEARQCYVKLLDMAPDDITALNNVAYLLAEAVTPPRPADALKYSTHAYELMQRSGQRDASIIDTHGWMLTLAGNTDQGIDMLRQCLEIKQIPDTHYHLGEAYLKKQFAEEAQRELDLAMDLINQYKKNKQALDPTLEGKVTDAMVRAGKMIRDRKTQANTNGQ